MASAKDLFHQEFGVYFATVGEDSPVGVCAKCLTARARADVDPKEVCPAELLELGWDGLRSASAEQLDKMRHSWQVFKERKALEEFVKGNGASFKQLIEGAKALEQSAS